MDRAIALRIIALQERALNDPEYMQVLARYKRLEQEFMELLPRLEAERRSMLWEYFCLHADLHQRMMELACTDEK